MGASIIVGAQWGDEGKGKVVDRWASKAEAVVRFGGGANAGHTLITPTGKLVLHQIPSGALHPHVVNIIASGCVVDLEGLVGELAGLMPVASGFGPDRLAVSPQAHVVTPYHRWFDAVSGKAIGTTGRGIGPAYSDKAGRRGVRVADFYLGGWQESLAKQFAWYEAVGRALYGKDDLPSLADVCAKMESLAETLRPYVRDLTDDLLQLQKSGGEILYEGAQGAMLDIDAGTYPYVTSSHTTIAGAAAGTGIYTPFERRVAVMKAYTTRVGEGPFPTEMDAALDEQLRQRGGEFGATTGRARRCGWLDLVALREVCDRAHMTHIALTKLDVLSGFGKLKVGVGYKADGSPEYMELDGFDGDLNKARSFADLPDAARRYVEVIEDALETPVSFVSTGPGRDEGIDRGGRA